MNKTITTYPELTEWVTKFFHEDGLPLLILVSEVGKGKSRLVESVAAQHDAWYCKASQLTAFQLYLQCFKHRGKVMALDDVEAPLKDEKGRKMLMALCETDDADRTVAWYGTVSQLKVTKGKKTFKVPQEFKTNSRVMVICNDFEILTKNIGPLLSRGLVLFFEPPNEEVHRFAGEWFEDEEIYAFIGDNLSEIPSLDIRYYTNSATMKTQSLDWKAALLETWTNEPDDTPEGMVAALVNNPNYDSEEARVECFECWMVEAGLKGGSRASYYRIKERLKKKR